MQGLPSQEEGLKGSLSLRRGIVGTRGRTPPSGRLVGKESRDHQLLRRVPAKWQM